MFPTQWAEWNATGALMQLHSNLRGGSKMDSSKMHLHSSSLHFSLCGYRFVGFRDQGSKKGILIWILGVWKNWIFGFEFVPIQPSVFVSLLGHVGLGVNKNLCACVSCVHVNA